MAETTEPASVRRREGASVIDMPAHIDISSETALKRAYSEAAGKEALLLNFTGTEFINSSGIAVIVGIMSQARKDGRVIAAYGLSPHYREIFEITRLADHMGLYADEQAAVAGRE